MSYKYSICHPDKSEIEYPDKILTDREVKEIVENYNWAEKLNKLKSMNQNDVCYSPSLDFTKLSNNFSFCLSAISDSNKMTFYVFYKRLIMKKILFGLFGEKETFSVVDKEFVKDEAYDLLDKFLRNDYKSIERKMTE